MSVTPELTPLDFAACMAACGPYEGRPHVAVAVSGGADSMALILLADAWARERGGQATALTVDHGLRPEAAAEAAQVKVWLVARAIAHETLTWTGEKPKSGIQAAAREARYGLLLNWCRRHQVLHLLLAHHAGDQAETVALRAAKGSGPAGLAAMAAVAPPPEPGPRWPRLLRPLLGIGKDRLEATLRSHGQRWIEDPSNLDPRYERVRIRQGLSAEETARLTAEAARHAEDRRKVAADLAPHLAAAVTLYPEGYGVVDREALRAVPAYLMEPLWRRVLMTVGGRRLPPRRERIARLIADLALPNYAGGTVAGCHIALKSKHILVAREAAAVHPVTITDDAFLWDNRFLLRLRPGLAGGEVRRLDDALWKAVKGQPQADVLYKLPHLVRAALPCVVKDGRALVFSFQGGESGAGAVHFAAASPLLF